MVSLVLCSLPYLILPHVNSARIYQAVLSTEHHQVLPNLGQNVPLQDSMMAALHYSHRMFLLLLFTLVEKQVMQGKILQLLFSSWRCRTMESVIWGMKMGSKEYGSCSTCQTPKIQVELGEKKPSSTYFISTFQVQKIERRYQIPNP